MNHRRTNNNILRRVFPGPEGFDLNYLTLRFRDKKLESAFLEDYFHESRAPSRFVTIFSVVFYASFIFLDIYLLPELTKSFLIIRFLIVIPFSFIVIAVSYLNIYRRLFQPLLSLMTFLGGAGIIAMIYISSDFIGNPLLSFYFVGLILVFIFGYNFLKLRYGWASLACWSISILYFYVALFKIEIPTDHLVTSLFFILCGNLMSQFAGYHFEFNTRRNFFLQEKLATEKHKVIEMNLTLEDKVNARTKELELAKNKAEESDQLKSMFLTNISHEIRTPMNGILGFSSLLASTELEEEKRNQFIGIINERGHYLMRILDNLLDISMIESKNISYNASNIEVNYFLKKLKSFLDGYYLNKENGLELDLPNEELELILKTDEVKLGQIITNLVNNASKYAEDSPCIFGYTKQETSITFYVKDKGPGIPDHYKAHIFKRFVTGEKKMTDHKSGTGLGLAISKGLADFMGAELSFESQTGKGTTFFLKFDLPGNPE